ncbi:hypothetical protein OQA88_3993 [Cercophora sp. LCS_1]
MTEVSSHAVPHRLGAPSHRIIAPAPAPPSTPIFAPNILYDMSFQPSANESYYGPPRSHMGARSSSVSSSSSSASYNAASSRTLSPALSVSESLAGSGIVARSLHQQPYQRPLYPAHTQPPVFYHSPSQYLHAQTGSQYLICAPTPAPRAFPQASNFGFRQASLPPSQPPAASFQQYPAGYSAFATQPYQAPSQLLPSYHPHTLADLRQAHLEDRRTPILATPAFPLEILNRITRHLGYLDGIRLSQVNRWLHGHVNLVLVPEEEKTSFILNAEREYERYSLRPAASSAPGGRGGRDSGHLSCYHCFKIKDPGEFELFRYNDTDQIMKGGDSNPSTPRSRPKTLPTSNPHYDPSITRTSILAKAKPATPGLGSGNQSSPRIRETWGIRRFCIDCGVQKGYYKAGALIELRSSGPAKERRGRKDEHGKDQIEAKWICQCLKVHKKPRAIRCDVCGSLTPFSQDRAILN